MLTEDVHLTREEFVAFVRFSKGSGQGRREERSKWAGLCPEGGREPRKALSVHSCPLPVLKQP